MRFFLPMALATLAILTSGCASSYGPHMAPTGAGIRGTLGAPIQFSDEISRDRARQTKALLALKSRDYLIGPDDVLEISIFEWEMREQTKTLDFRVSESGMISLPAIGPVAVANKSVQDIQLTIEKDLSSKGVLQNPRVGVAVKEFRSRRIAVVGAVNAPGVYAIHENVSTLMDMITLAGGASASAGQIAHVLRKQVDNDEPLRIVVDLEELFNEGKFDLNAVLQGDDIVYVPQAPLIYVYGTVRQPGGFALRRSMRLVEAIALAGGVAPRADKRNCFLVRRVGKSGEQVAKVDLKAIEHGKAPNPYLQEGDVVHVPESPGKIALSELWSVFRGIFTFTYRLDSN
jgi:polysaccharide biosynthesis/export protein